MATPSNQLNHKHPSTQPQRISEESITKMGQIFPGFAKWYQANYDKDGRYIDTPIAGLHSAAREEARHE